MIDNFSSILSENNIESALPDQTATKVNFYKRPDFSESDLSSLHNYGQRQVKKDNHSDLLNSKENFFKRDTTAPEKNKEESLQHIKSLGDEEDFDREVSQRFNDYQKDDSFNVGMLNTDDNFFKRNEARPKKKKIRKITEETPKKPQKQKITISKTKLLNKKEGSVGT